MKISGYYFWLWQRISGMMMLITLIVLLVMYKSAPSLDRWRWLIFHSSFSPIMCASYCMMLLHAAMGGYVVVTDYIKNKRYQIAMLVFLGLYLAWGFLGAMQWVL